MIEALISHAELTFRDQKAVSGKSTIGDHMAAARALKGKPARRASSPPAPLEHLWLSFLELHLARSSNGYGPNPISYAEIQAWSTLTDRPLQPWMVGVMRRLDDTYLRVSAEKPKEAAS